MEKIGFAISLGVKEFQSRAEVTVSFLGQDGMIQVCRR